MITNNGSLFIGALSTGDKEFLKVLLKNARTKGYDRFIEPCAGALAMSFLAAESGFDPKKIEASDVSYFSGVYGRAVSDQSIEDMGIKAKGFTEEELKDPATALYAQLYLKSLKSAGKEYFYELIRDLKYRKAEHIQKINEEIDKVKEKCKGMKYFDKDMWVHLDETMNDEHAVIILCPPTYTAGYEKFFDTAGMVQWNEPEYGIFDIDTGLQELRDKVQNAKALVIWYEERPAGESVGVPIYARDAGREGIYVYLVSNRPEEATELAHGKNIGRKGGVKMSPLKKPILPSEYEVTENSVVDVVHMKAENATYYRRLWTHNFVGGASGSCMALIIDGYIAGVFGYDKFTMSLGSNSDLFFKFGIAAPSKQRLNRLMYMLETNREIVNNFLDDIQKEKTKGVFTTMITKYPESKEMRGLMKMTAREYDALLGYKLRYRCDIQDRSKEETLKEWVKKEQNWLKARNKSKN